MPNWVLHTPNSYPYLSYKRACRWCACRLQTLPNGGPFSFLAVLIGSSRLRPPSMPANRTDHRPH